MPSLTVIVPFYNEETFLSKSLYRLINTNLADKILLIDDCSTDKSAEIAKKFEREFNNISLIQSSVNSGKGGAMSLSVNYLDTDFVVVHDADLEYNPTDLIEMFNLAVDNPEYFESEPLDITELSDSSYLVTVDDQEYSVTLKADNSVTINDGSQVNQVTSSPSVQAGTGEAILAPLGGNIFRVIVSEGESVAADSTILILEAMKMETEIKAPSAGVVGKIFVKPGDTVKPGTPLFEIVS